MKEDASKVMDKPLGELQEVGVKALLWCHGVEKSASREKAVAQMRHQCCQLMVI